MASDSDSSYNPFMTRAFYFDDGDDEFDLNLPPSSGAEYLRRVQLEARQCPDVMVADIDQSHFVGKQTVKINAGKGCSPAPHGYAPSKYWQKMQIANFSELRTNMTRFKSCRPKAETEETATTAKITISLPDIHDDVGWCRFCFGDRFQKILAAKTVGDVPTPDRPSNTAIKRKIDVLESSGVQPLVSVVIGMSQPLIEQVLDYHITWFEATGFNVQQGQWFFALLACLEKPLTPEACSSIRTLARQCANLRASLNKDNPILSHLNLLICLVAGYFDQRDLADA